MMVNSSNPIDLLISMQNGTCSGAVMTSAEWDSVYNYEQANIGEGRISDRQSTAVT